MVVAGVKKAVAEQVPVADAQAELHEGLLATVSNLVEYPYPICGHFDEKFLQVPAEAIITSMRENQKYFPVKDGKGALLPYFVAVNNTCIEDRSLAVSGHERVLRGSFTASARPPWTSTASTSRKMRQPTSPMEGRASFA